MSGRVIPELDDGWVSVERRLDDAALHTASAAMNKANFTQTGRLSGLHIIGDDSGHVARREGMEVELASNGNAHVTLRKSPSPRS